MAENKNGERCNRRTCKYSDYCWQHTKIYKGLKLKKSNIPGANIGLFATKEFKKGQKIADYRGRIMSQAEYDKLDNWEGVYGVEIKKGEVMNADTTQDGLGRYANHCRPKNIRAKHCKGNNAKISISHRGDDPKVSLKATKKIRPGQEIYVNYGPNYWK